MLALAADLARQAGTIIRAVRAAGFETLRKEDHSPVTEADHRAEALIAAALRAATPAIPVMAEEEAAAGKEHDACATYWLVDPLDGTREFAAGRKEFTVNIGLVHHGVTRAGRGRRPRAGGIVRRHRRAVAPGSGPPLGEQPVTGPEAARGRA